MAKTRPGWEIRIFATIFMVLLCGLPVVAHTNVERIMRVAQNGTTIQPEGYPRGFWARTAPGYYDNANVYLVPPNGNISKAIRPGDKLAHEFQRTYNYTAPYNPLTAAPGDLITLQYQENGHVSLPERQPNKTLNRGTIYIYGTSDFNGEADLLDIHYQWNQKGTGGDRKGKLLATRNFDDGRCHENNDGPIATQRAQQFNKSSEQPMGTNLWCQSDLLLPTDLPVGERYTLLWVWDWPTMDRPGIKVPPSSAPGAPPGENGAIVTIPELYTTVVDVNIVDPCDDALGEVKGPTCATTGNTRQAFHVTETDLNVAAIQGQIKDMFLVDVTALIGAAANNPSHESPGTTTSLSSGGSSSQASANPTGGGLATTTTTTASLTVTTSTVPTTTLGHGGQVSTTTVYDSVTVTTVTVNPSSKSAKPATATASAIRYTTLTTFATTVIETVTGPSSSSPTSRPSSAPAAAPTTSKSIATASASGSTSSMSSQIRTATDTGTGGPTVTRFLKDTKPTGANKGRRAVGQWGFGRRDD